MPGKNKTPLLGWHPPAGLSAWVRAEAARRDVPLSVILNEALEAKARWEIVGFEIGGRVYHPSDVVIIRRER